MSAIALKENVAGKLKREITEKKDASSGTILGSGEPKRAVHLERREADVDAVEIGDEIKCCEEWD